MKLVAAAKVNKMQKKIKAARPYADGIKGIFAELQNCLSEDLIDENPLLKKKSDVQDVLLIVVASDIGLCGAYNSNIFKKSSRRIKELQEENKNIHLITVGRKARDFFAKKHWKEEGINLLKSYIQLPTIPSQESIKEISDLAANMYTSNEVQKVELISTRFINLISSEVEIKNFLPVDTATDENQNIPDVIMEPSAESILETLVPMYLNNTIFTYILEATTSELAARMTAMSNATSNADTVIKKFVLQYNKARQAAITQEISEIVGGAASLAA